MCGGLLNYFCYEVSYKKTGTSVVFVSMDIEKLFYRSSYQLKIKECVNE